MKKEAVLTLTKEEKTPKERLIELRDELLVKSLVKKLKKMPDIRPEIQEKEFNCELNPHILKALSERILNEIL